MFPHKLLEKIGTIGTGHFLNFMINNGFDYGIYIPVIAFFGPIWGCGIMIILSMILNITLIWVYDKTGKDWLGFEMLKEGKEELSTGLPNWIRNLIQLGDFGAFIGLSIYDPFMATIYLRKKENVHNGLSKRDWRIFFSATILSNVGWTGLVYGGISGFQWLLKTAQLLW